MSVASFKRIAVKVAVAIPIFLLGAVLMHGVSTTFNYVQTWWNSQQKIRVKGKALCAYDLTPLSSDETLPDGAAIKNECWVRIKVDNYFKTVKTSRHGTYAFTDVPTLHGIEVGIVRAVHHHTHKGVERSVGYMSDDSTTSPVFSPISDADTLFGFVKPQKDRGEWHIGPTLYGKPAPTPTTRFQID